MLGQHDRNDVDLASEETAPFLFFRADAANFDARGPIPAPCARGAIVPARTPSLRRAGSENGGIERDVGRLCDVRKLDLDDIVPTARADETRGCLMAAASSTAVRWLEGDRCSVTKRSRRVRI